MYAQRAFLFTDVESSTRLWERYPEDMERSLAQHDDLLRTAVETAGGRVVKTTGDGLMAVFPDATAAVRAAVSGQVALAGATWGETGALRVRMGIHEGPVQERGEDYFGPTVNRTARIMAAGHGGQVLLSGHARSHVADPLPDGIELRDLGEHRLKDLFVADHVYQLIVPGLADRFPPLATLDRIPNNLPTQTTPFVGREEQIAAVRVLLDDTGVRLVSLTGPGGTGKTRLAMQAAAAQIDRFSDGVFFVDLSPDTDVEAALSRVLRTVAMPHRAAEQALDSLTTGLRQRQMLLVLDNCEQVVAIGAALVHILASCESVKVLVTTREALRVRGERPYPVPPMALPRELASAEEAMRCEAVQFFVARAVDSRPDFVLDRGNVSDVVAICHRLDGLPLALELAAARLRLFSTAQLRSRLQLPLLRGGPRDLPVRQQTLQATIDWSYALLHGAEQELLALLSVFEGADVEAVEDVGERSGLAARLDIVDGLDSLVSKSLVRVQPGSTDGRLGMLQTIREFAAAKLAADPEGLERARLAHAQHYADFVAAAQVDLVGPTRAGALDRLDAELGNALAAWRYFASIGDLDRLVTMLESLWVLHNSRGRYQGVVDLANDMLRVLSTTAPTPDRRRLAIDLQTSLARALMALAGYTDEVETAYEQALKLAAESGDAASTQRFPVLRSLASLHQMRMEFAAGAEVGRELLRLAAEQHDPTMLMDAHVVLGASLSFEGEPDEGMRHLNAAVDLFQPAPTTSSGLSLGPHPGVTSLIASALLLWMHGQPAEAMRRARLADEASRVLRHPYSRAYALYHLAFLHLLQRDMDRMSLRADELLVVASSNGYTMWRALAMLLQGLARVAAGEPDPGLALMDEALSLYQTTSAPPVFWVLVLCIRTTGFMLAGRWTDAAELCDEALRLAPDGSPDRNVAVLLRGDILLSSGDSDTAGAEEVYRSALRSSRESGMRMFELLAATRLVGTAHDAASRTSAEVQLQAVFDTFTDGCEFPDLAAARAALSG